MPVWEPSPRGPRKWGQAELFDHDRGDEADDSEDPFEPPGPARHEPPRGLWPELFLVLTA